MTDFLDSSAAEIRSRLRTGDLTPVDLLDATLHRIDERNPAINAIAHRDDRSARAAAEASAARWAAGAPLSDLDGLPVTIKDSINAVGTPWRHGSAAHTDVPDSRVDSPPAARLKEAGAVIVAKTTMPDFGMMAAGVSSLYGIVRNPWDTSRNTGGSSAGAGACLAAGIGFGAVGTDIAGSVRLPAGQCGVVALKPTQGRIPHLPASTTRSPGPMARTVDEAIDLYRVIAGFDARDALALGPDSPDGLDADLPPAGLRIGVLSELDPRFPLDQRVREVLQTAADVLASGGADVRALTAPFGVEPSDALDRVFQVRARTEWEGIAPAKRDLVHPAVADWAAAAAGYSATDHARDLGIVDGAQAALQAATAEFDFVLAPVIPTPGFAAETVGIDATHPLAHCTFTAWFNQTGQPASSVPFGLIDGCPVGLQVAGPRLSDQRVLRLTRWLEVHRPVPLGRPPLFATAGGTR
ncbi:amidase [Tsukamurella sputi]|uniref:Amidase n=1 Tax=Tsukamurella sputi TaxID=2591848 RepID=A0A5C5RSQ2_9ACTN|nr:amidase family protein [Tsukamurella sputi]TWS25045.1 amidase [Tsukamurella sputi]